MSLRHAALSASHTGGTCSGAFSNASSTRQVTSKRQGALVWKVEVKVNATTDAQASQAQRLERRFAKQKRLRLVVKAFHIHLNLLTSPGLRWKNARASSEDILLWRRTRCRSVTALHEKRVQHRKQQLSPRHSRLLFVAAHLPRKVQANDVPVGHAPHCSEKAYKIFLNHLRDRLTSLQSSPLDKAARHARATARARRRSQHVRRAKMLSVQLRGSDGNAHSTAAIVATAAVR